MAAAVADHGGEGSRSEIVRCQRVANAHRRASARLDAASVRVEQEAPVAASHHGKPEPHETAGLIPEFVRNPIALGDRRSVEESCGDLGIARLFQASVERSECEDQPITTVCCERARIGSGLSSRKGSP